MLLWARWCEFEVQVVYGINTGFGLFSNVTVPSSKLEELQDNLIRSHSAGVGPLLSRERCAAWPRCPRCLVLRC